MLVQNDSIRMHFAHRKYAHMLLLESGHSRFTSGIIKELFLTIIWSKYEELNSERYSDMLQNQLKPPIQKKNAMVFCPMVCACSMIMPNLIQPIIL